MNKQLFFTFFLLLVFVSGCSFVEDFQKGKEIGEQLAKNANTLATDYDVVTFTLDLKESFFNGRIYGVYENGSTIGIGTITDGKGLYNKTPFSGYFIEAKLNGTSFLSEKIGMLNETTNLDSEKLYTKKFIFLWEETLHPVGEVDVYADNVFIETLPKTSISTKIPLKTKELLINGTYQNTPFTFMWELNKGDLREGLIPLYVKKQTVLDKNFVNTIDETEIERSIDSLLTNEGLVLKSKLNEIASKAHKTYFEIISDELNDFIYDELKRENLQYYYNDWFIEETVVFEGKDYISVLKEEVSDKLNYFMNEVDIAYSHYGLNVDCHDTLCEVFVVIVSDSYSYDYELDEQSFTNIYFFENIDNAKINLQLKGKNIFNAYLIDDSLLPDFRSRFMYEESYADLTFKRTWENVRTIDEDIVVRESDTLIIENNLDTKNDFSYKFTFK